MDDLSRTDGMPTSTGRRRYVTVLFSDVSNSSTYAEELEAEEYAALLERFRKLVRDVIPRHGGTIARMQGDGVLALFGHLGAREDDGRRATEAALELHAAVSRLRIHGDRAKRSLQLHSGIHAGLMLLLEGDIERGRHDVVGEVPNTAARLCTMAATGHVLVSRETLGPHAYMFDVARSRRVAVRGRRAPLDVLRVSGKALVERRIDAAARRGVVPFVGRDEALATLLEATAAESPRQVLLVSGEPGVGKSRLLDEFQRRVDRGRCTVIEGYCESYLGAQPLQPFLQGLGQSDKTSENPVTGAAPTARIAAIVSALTRQADGRTLVLILDDWQWADDASRTTLHQVLESARPVVAVLAARSGELDEDPTGREAQRVTLQPLPPNEGERAVRAWLPDADPFLVQEIGLVTSQHFGHDIKLAATIGTGPSDDAGRKTLEAIGEVVGFNRAARVLHLSQKGHQVSSDLGIDVAVCFRSL